MLCPSGRIISENSVCAHGVTCGGYKSEISENVKIGSVRIEFELN